MQGAEAEFRVCDLGTSPNLLWPRLLYHLKEANCDDASVHSLWSHEQYSKKASKKHDGWFYVASVMGSGGSQN